MELDQEARERAEIEAIVLTPEQEASIDLAMAEARDPYDYEVAVSAEFDRRNALLLVKLKSGQRLAIPQEDLQDLAEADPELVGKVEIEMLGTSLHWEELDVDFGVDGLRQGRYGAEWWMQLLAESRGGCTVGELPRSA